MCVFEYAPSQRIALVLGLEWLDSGIVVLLLQQLFQIRIENSVG